MAKATKNVKTVVAPVETKSGVERDEWGANKNRERSYRTNCILRAATEPMTPSQIVKAALDKYGIALQAVSNHLMYLQNRDYIVNHGDSTYSRVGAPWLKPAKKATKK